MKKNSRIDCSPRSKLCSLIIAMAIFLILHQIHDVQYFPWDAKGYWELSNPKIFFNYPKEIRGYFYPLLLLPAHFFSNIFEYYQNYSYRFFSAFIYAYLLTSVLPAFYVRIFGGTLTTSRRLITPLLIAILFPGLIIYPLSDLPAFLLLIGSISALLSAKTAVTRITAGGYAVLGGCLLQVPTIRVPFTCFPFYAFFARCHFISFQLSRKEIDCQAY